MNQITNTVSIEKGSITIEAALIIPFVIGVGMLFFSMMSMIHEHAKEQIELDGKMLELSMQSYQLTRFGIIDTNQEDVEGSIQLLNIMEEGYGDRVARAVVSRGKQFVLKQWARNKLDIVGMDIGNRKDSAQQGSENHNKRIRRISLFDYKGKGEVFVSQSYGFPMIGREASIKLLYGGFLVLFEGEGSYNASAKSDNKDEESQDKVYVTSSGSKYHVDPTCFHIKVHATSRYWKSVPTKKICKYCGGGVRYQPNRRIYTTNSSRVVHLDEACSAISHEVHEMTKDEAISNGLSACKSCTHSSQ